MAELLGSLVDMGIPPRTGEIIIKDEVKSGKILAFVDLMDTVDEEIEEISSMVNKLWSQ